MSNKPMNCPFFRSCGGCKYYHDDYAYSLREKQKKVNGLLSTYGRVHPIIGMEDPFRYRNKATSEVRYDFRKGRHFSGKYSPNSHKVAKITDCLIESRKSNEIVNSIVNLMSSFKYQAYDEDRETGLIRHIQVRNNKNMTQWMVVLVVADYHFPSKKNFAKALVKLHPEIRTIVLNLNNNKTSMVLGERNETIYGPGYLTDTINDLSFKISPSSFFQVNNVQTEVIYQKVLQLANLKGTETVLDAYCGIGTIGMALSGKAKSVIGVELNKDAVRDAIDNAKFNKIENVRFVQADATDYIVDNDQQLDMVIMDPPRSGSDERFIKALIDQKINKVVYVSCNPEALADEMDQFIKGGYRATDFYPIDNFPFTDHVETVVLMSRADK